LNGYTLKAEVDEQERVMLALASSALSREELLAWLEKHTHNHEDPI